MASGPKLKITITGDASEALKQVKALEQSLGSLAGKKVPDTTAPLREGVKQTTKEVSKFKDGLKDLQKNIAAAFAISAIVGFAKSAVQASTDSQSAFKGLESVANRTGVGISTAWADAQKLSADGLMSLTDSATSLKNLYARGFSAEQSIKIIERFKDAAAFGRQSTLSFSEAVRGATEGLKNENSMLVDNAGVTKNVAKMWQDWADKMGRTTDSMTLAEKRQAEYNGVMTETAAQVGDAQKALAGYQGQQAKLAQTTNDLKIKLGEGFTPIFSTLANGAMVVVDRFIMPLNKGFQQMGLQISALGAMFANFWNLIKTRDIGAFIQQRSIDMGAYMSGMAEIDSRFSGKGPTVNATDNIDTKAVAERQKQEAEAAARAAAEAAKETAKEADKARKDAEEEQRRFQKQLVEYIGAVGDAAASAAKAQNEQQLADLEQAKNNQLITEKEYIDKKYALDMEALAIERSVLEARLQMLSEAAAKATTDSERLRASGDIVSANSALASLDSKQAGVSSLYGANRTNAGYNDAQRNAGFLQGGLDVKSAALQQQLVEGTITQTQYEVQLKDAKLATVAAMQEYVAAMEASAGVDQTKITAVAELKQKMSELSTTFDADAQAINMSISENLVGAFNEIISGAKSAKDAFKDMGMAILQTIQKIIMQKMIEQVFSSIGGASGGWGGLISTGLKAVAGGGMAEGGWTGPGSKYTPAGYVHADEYVFSKAAVNRLGVGNLERLHRSAKRGYADGGLVSAAPAFSGAAEPMPTRIVNVIDDSMIHDGMSSPGGEKVILNVIRKNSSGVKQMIG